MNPHVSTRVGLRRDRRPRAHNCWDHLLIAPLWPMHDANLGTLLRTCDAVGAPASSYRAAAASTPLSRRATPCAARSCVHRITEPLAWLRHQRGTGAQIVAVEPADDAVRLGDVPAARTRTVAGML